MDRGDVTIGWPPRWRHTADPEHGIVMAAFSPTAPASGFAPRLLLDAEQVDEPFAAWQEHALVQLDTLLDDLDEEDSDDYELEGEHVRYRRISFRSGDHDLVAEQWCWLVEGIGFTLTGTVARADYADYTDLFEDVAGTFSVRRQARA